MGAAELEKNVGEQSDVLLRRPEMPDGARVWEIARDSKVLDLNTSYAYLLWCHDFADTSVVAEVDGRVVGFVTGFRRPTAPDVFMLWQVAVDADQRGNKLAGRMIHNLLDRLVENGVRWLHTTVAPDNEPSLRLFHGVARDRGVAIERHDFITPEHFPDDGEDKHQPEDLYTIGPLNRTVTS